jgi:hypothetical protein
MSLMVIFVVIALVVIVAIGAAIYGRGGGG